MKRRLGSKRISPPFESEAVIRNLIYLILGLSSEYKAGKETWGGGRR